MKKWYTSRTLWVNAVGVVAIVVQAIAGEELIDAEAQVAILGVINLILRAITNTGIAK